MKKIIELDSFRKRQANSEARGNSKNRKRALARMLICRAASLLEDVGEREHRVGWLLEDCADLLSATGVGLECASLDSMEALCFAGEDSGDDEDVPNTPALGEISTSELADDHGAATAHVLRLVGRKFS